MTDCQGFFKPRTTPTEASEAKFKADPKKKTEKRMYSLPSNAISFFKPNSKSIKEEIKTVAPKLNR
ncbi:hypothetical protein GCM10027567_16420 [Spongiibacter taiwanensis]